MHAVNNRLNVYIGSHRSGLAVHLGRSIKNIFTAIWLTGVPLVNPWQIR